MGGFIYFSLENMCVNLHWLINLVQLNSITPLYIINFFSDASWVCQCCTVSKEYISSSVQLSFNVHEKSIKSQLMACTKNVHEFAFWKTVNKVTWKGGRGQNRHKTLTKADLNYTHNNRELSALKDSWIVVLWLLVHAY